MTNVVNPSQKTIIISEKALGLTTFVTTDQKSTLKTPRIDDVCNNTHQTTPKTQHARPPRDADSKQQDLAKQQANAPSQPHWYGGRRRDRRARPRCRRAAAGPGRASSQRAQPHTATRRRRCGGRRRDRRARASLQTRGLAAVPEGGGRARAGLEIDHSEPQARVWRSRGRAAAHRHTQRPGPSRQATRRPEIRRHSTSTTTGKRKPTTPGMP